MKKCSFSVFLFALFLSACTMNNAPELQEGTRMNPYPIGTTGTYDALGAYVGYKIELTVLEVIRGEEAAKIVAKADENAAQVVDGKEYMLVKFHVKALESDDDSSIEIGNMRFSFISEQGVSYPTSHFIYNLDAEFQTMYVGGEQDGYVFNMIDVNDNPVIAYLENSPDVIFFSTE